MFRGSNIRRHDQASAKILRIANRRPDPVLIEILTEIVHKLLL